MEITDFFFYTVSLRHYPLAGSLQMFYFGRSVGKVSNVNALKTGKLGRAGVSYNQYCLRFWTNQMT